MALMRPIAEAAHELLDGPDAEDTAAQVQLEERRLQVRDYYCWLDAADGKAFPTLAEMEASDFPEMLVSSFVLDLREDVLNPQFLHIGDLLVQDCEADTAARIKSIADVPPRSLLSRLSEHYLQCFSNRAPIGFEAIYSDLRDDRVKYRGIILPISSNGQEVDYVWGTINGTVDAEEPDGPPPQKDRATKRPKAEPVKADAPENSPEHEKLAELCAPRLAELLEVPGVRCAALVDSESRKPLLIEGAFGKVDVAKLAIGCAKVLSEKQALVGGLTDQEQMIESMLFTLPDAFYLIQPIASKFGVNSFILTIADQDTANTAMIQFKVSRISADL